MFYPFSTYFHFFEGFKFSDFKGLVFILLCNCDFSTMQLVFPLLYSCDFPLMILVFLSL